MKIRTLFPIWILFLIVGIFLGPSFMTPLRPALAAGPSSVQRALLIGIGKYEALPRLPGSKNDIELVHQVLVSRFGFSEKYIRMFLTRGQHERAFLPLSGRLLKKLGPMMWSIFIIPAMALKSRI